ncbi:MAG: LysM peptidoglycan-binding domain-containing protein [Halofilum sp. (in: g-proteobacteria)]
MKISAYTKRLSVAALVLGLAVACATSPEEETETCEGISSDVQAAIDEAKSVNADAREMGADWRGARKMINQAESAGSECEDDKAIQLAEDAQQMAEESIEAYRRKQEEEEKKAAEEEEDEPEDREYTVERGDTLWDISGSSDGYDDPYQWPLIYKANEDKIKDADLIFPDQEFVIEAEPSSSEVDRATKHAKNRGEWELGVTEGSDLEYLKGD